MVSFKIFCERHMPIMDILEKYEDDENAFLHFADPIEPRAMKDGKSVDKKTTRLGLNPLTSYDTPAGIYGYPIKQEYENIKQQSLNFAMDRRHMYVFRPKNPERCARVSTYTNEDFHRDFDELKEMYPKYHLDDIYSEADDPYYVTERYPNYKPIYKSENEIFIGREYRHNPLQMFWSITRALAYLIFSDITKSKDTKTKHITIWTHIMRQFYDGIIDDTGSKTIHVNEPYQGVFWTAAHIRIIEHIDRSEGVKKDPKKPYYDPLRSWTRNEKLQQLLSKREILKLITDAYLNHKDYTLPPSILELLRKSEFDNYFKALVGGSAEYFKDTNFRNWLTQDFFQPYVDAFIPEFFKNIETPGTFDGRIIPFLNSETIKNNINEIVAHLEPNAPTEAIIRLSRHIGRNVYHFSQEQLIAFFDKLKAVDDESIMQSFIKDVFDYTYYTKLKTYQKFVIKLIKTFVDSLQHQYSDYDKLEITEMILTFLMKWGIKNRNIWEGFFPIIPNFTGYGGYSYSVKNYFENITKLFLDSGTNLEQMFKEYVNSRLSNIQKQELSKLDDLWFQYTGNDLFVIETPQADVIKKSKKINPIISEFKPGDVLGYIHYAYSHGLDAIERVEYVTILTPYDESTYTVQFENGSVRIVEKNRLTANPPDIKFEQGDLVEDVNGTVYRVIFTYVSKKEVALKNKKGQAVYLHEKDIAKYDPNNSLKENKFVNGHYAKVIEGYYKGNVGIIENYDPVLEIVHLSIQDYTRQFSVDELEYLGNKYTPKYKKGDTLMDMYSDIYVIDSVGPPDIEYPEGVYKTTDGKTYNAMYFDNANYIYKGDSANKYNKGDVIYLNSLDQKIIIKDMKLPNYTIDIVDLTTGKLLASNHEMKIKYLEDHINNYT